MDLSPCLRPFLPLLSCALLYPGALPAAEWVDVTSALLTRLTNNGAQAAWPGGCSGVVANRLTGAVTVKVVGLGLWRSTDQGQTWTQVDHNTISGRDETGWATSVDQNNPSRLASFSLDGTAGWTTNGKDWQQFTDLGRNWDFGSVNWAQPSPKTIIAAKHETDPPGEVYLTTDGGRTWAQLDIHVNSHRDKISMVGTMNATTFIYSKGDGIERSTDSGRTWTRVSSANPQTRVPVLFQGAHYLGTETGLLVSRDDGATWGTQGKPVDIWLGPFFGADEKEMVIVGKQGAFRTRNAGEIWTELAPLKPKEKGFLFTPNWFGCYAWDPVHNDLYVSAMGNPVYRLKL